MTLERIADFDSELAEQPNGMVTLDDGTLAVSFPFLRQLRIFDPTDGSQLRVFENTAAPYGFMETRSDGKILASGVAIFDPAFDPSDPQNPDNGPIVAANGVWVVDPADGSATQLAAFPPQVGPSHYAELPTGVVLMSSLLTGQIFAVDPDGSSAPWTEDPVLSGSPELPGPPGRPPFPVGIEGIRLRDGAVHGVVADHGRIVRIPVLEDGGAGPVEVLFEAPEALLGIAHFVFDDRGDMVAISGFQSKVWKIDSSTDFGFEIWADNDSAVVVDTPSSITRGRGTNRDALYFTNFAFVVNDSKAPPAPGLTALFGAI